jgi:peptidyl-prolyl cis-trans isomerase SurA
MIVRNILLFLLGCLMIPGADGLAQVPPGKNEEPILFSVDKKPVSVDEFLYLYKKNHQHDKDEFTKEKIEEYLTLFINFKLKVAEAQSRGLDTTAAFRKEFTTYRDELRKPYLPDSKIIDSLVALTYERMKEEVNASHILVKVPPGAPEEEERRAYEKVMEIRKRAMAGEDFVKLAESLSEDESARVNKGNLGYFSALQMVYPFETAAYSNQKGDISMPVRTQFGYHILKINDRRPSSGEVEVSHIVIRTGENSDNEQAKNKIFDVYEQLQKGVAWDELCSQYSEDPSSKDNGGKLRPFGIGDMASVPQFEQTAFQLQKSGEYSDPFQTQFGWHIVKLERKIPLGSFAELSPSIRNRVSRDERVQLSKQVLYDKLKMRFGYKENTDTRKKILTLADSSLLNGKWKRPAYPNADKEVLFQLSGKMFTVGSFFDHVMQNQKRSGLAPSKYLEQLLNGFVESQILQTVEDNVMATNPEYKWLLKEYYEGILLFDIMEKEVWNKASADSVGQRSYFNNNAASYKAGERLKGTIYSATTKEHISRLKGLIEKNDTTALEETISTLRIKRDTGLFEKEDRIILTKTPWAVGIHLGENNNLSYLVHVKAILPPGLQTFEEARPEVISDYQNHLEKKWVELLKKKHQVKVNKKGKESAFSQLLHQKTP